MKLGISFSAPPRSSLLLPALVVLSVCQVSISFSTTRAPLQALLKRAIKRKMTCPSRFVRTVLYATREYPSMNARNMEEQDDHEYSSSRSNFAANDKSYAQYGSSALRDEEYDPMSEENDNNQQVKFNNHNRHQWNGRKKPRTLNPAMGDTAFLRKRTDKLLALSTASTNLSQDGISKGMKIDRKTFHFLIDSWAFSGEMDAAEQAIALLHKMEELYAGEVDSTNSHHIRPDVRTYTKVINAISRSVMPQAGQMAEEMLQTMRDLYQSGTNLAVKPNTFTYTAVAEAHANSGATGSAQSAEDICELMVQKYLQGDPDVRPTARSYNAAINAYAKSGAPGAAQRADDVFRRMEHIYLSTGLEEVKPNTYNYNSLISAWVNCGEQGAAQRAEEVLEKMEALYKAGDVEAKPTTVTFNAVIDAYSKSTEKDGYDDAGERAEKILKHMEELYESGENVDAKPNVRSFNTVINVWYVI